MPIDPVELTLPQARRIWLRALALFMLGALLTGFSFSGVALTLGLTSLLGAAASWNDTLGPLGSFIVTVPVIVQGVFLSLFVGMLSGFVPSWGAARKPVVMALTGDEAPLDPDFLTAMRESETPLFRSPERAMRAFAAVARYAAALQSVDDRTPVATGLLGWDAPGVKPEYVGKDFLRTLGVQVPAGGLAASLEKAVAIATRIGYPVVLKAQAVALSHKSDAGGVILNLRDEAALREGWAKLMANIGAVTLDGVLVEQMSAPGLELVVGARHHPEWGPSVLVGLGGVLIEALDAAELLPADISHARAVERIRGLRGARMLGKFRGKPARDVDAVADVVVKVGAAMRAGLAIEEIDINPLMVLAEGEGAVALDALIVTAA